MTNKLSYKLISKNNHFDPINTVLKNRGIKDIDGFLKAGERVDSELDYKLLKNIEKAVELIKKHVENNSTIFIQVDTDADGFLSSMSIGDYLKRINNQLKIVYNQHDSESIKKHGIVAEDVEEQIDLVIVPDAGSNDFEDHKKLSDRGIDVLVIDHHEIIDESEHAVVVNINLNDYPNKELSGTGVVYKVLQALDNEYNVEYSKHYLDLVAISLVSDIMRLDTYENRYYLTQGLKQINNPLIKTIVESSRYTDINKIVPTDVSFSIAPLINSVIRVGTTEEKEKVFNALFTSNEEELIETVDLMNKAKERQEEKVNEVMPQVTKYIEELFNNHENPVVCAIVLDGSNDIASLTGLIANKVLSIVKRPVLILRQSDKGYLSGSARGFDKSPIKDFKQEVLNTGLFDLAQGHDNAFGVRVSSTNKLEQALEKIQEKYKDYDIDVNVYDVDFILNGHEIKYALVHQIDKYNHLWGHGVEKPMLALENVEVERRQISVLGENKNVIKFSYRDIDYIKFRVDNKEIRHLMSGKSTDLLTMNVIGSVSINNFAGKTTAQVIIEDQEVIDVGEPKFLF